ncbi:AraC-like ligand-binding domain-containing protein [Paraburkholderia solitsugae]|nr:helix-turn-helix domain-containing protein [Paraburkholderia solitsugae]
MRSTFSLDDLPISSRFQYWCDLSETLFVPVSLECDTPETFTAKYDGRNFGPTRFGTSYMGRLKVNRTSEHIARSQADPVKLIVPLSGAITISQDKKHTVVRPGQFYLVDPVRPYQEQIIEGLTFHWAHIPREAVTSRIGRIEQVTATAFSNRSPYGRLSTDFIHSISHVLDSVEGAAAEHISAVALDLFTMACWEQTDKLQPRSTIHRSALRHRAKAFIDEHLSDPDLTLGDVAAALGISTRYVGGLLVEGGIAYRQYVLDQRLARCARDLIDPRMGQQSVTCIAFSCGFNDGAHFSRAFKAAYGMSPRDYRASRQ